MKVLKNLGVAIGVLLLMLSIFFGFASLMIAAVMNYAYASNVWGQVPGCLHLRVFAWNGLLVINTLTTLITSGYLFFRLFVPPFISDKRDS